MAKLCLLVVASIVTVAFSDLYMHCPRGSNNRLNEATAERTNGNRLFDSQNNARGGVNVGVRTDDTFNANNPTIIVDEMYDASRQDLNAQYAMVYFDGSVFPVEWTNQHGCGGNDRADPNKLNCNMVLQYTCDTSGGAYSGDYSLEVHMRDGGNTQTPDEPNTPGEVSSRTVENTNNANQRGRHESEGWYYECKTRSRNKRLFTADQNLNGNSAIYTRQNPNGDRRGLECPEERDYYPYWAPNPWRDIAYLTDRLDKCDWIKQESMNLVGHTKSKCRHTSGNYGDNTNIIRALTPQDCQTAGGTWTAFTHGMPVDAVNDPPRTEVFCGQMEWTRDNHLGNGRFGQPAMFNYTLPTWAQLTSAGNLQTFGALQNYLKCVFRLRYNITTDDYDPWNTTSDQNQNIGQGKQSPVTQNPTVDVGSDDLQGLQLAINTNQFGRVFQDRSHIFYIKERPGAFNGKRIINFNVRGKRGNIVQTYPAVEYDFCPNIFTVSAANDLIHFQWTGSNTHNNGSPGGDGQTGDAGQGRGGTDRHGFVQTDNSDSNYPIPLDKYPQALVLTPNSICFDHNGNNLEVLHGASGGVHCALRLATSGQYLQRSEASNTFDPLLNDAPASLIGGLIMQPVRLGVYNYIDVRNNNFSNRAQKGGITVQA